MVLKDGVLVELTKVKFVTKWNRPTTVTEVYNFLRLARYYQRFVQNFAKIASPLTQLTKKGTLFIWSDTCEMSFQDLKQRLVSYPILTFQRTHKEMSFIVMTLRKG